MTPKHFRYQVNQYRMYYHRGSLNEYQIKVLEEMGFRWKYHEYLPMEDAMKFSVGLGFKRVRQWMEYTKHNRLPPGIPVTPITVYRGKGWINWQHWLTGNAGLLKDHPLFAEIHPTKNENVDFSVIITGSKIKIWWLCKKCGESWNAIIRDRISKNTGCRFCSGQGVSKTNSVGASPAMSLWHPTKNKDIDPFAVYKNGGVKYWWFDLECEHEWETTPKSISIGHGCLICAGKVSHKDTCLSTKYPHIAKMLDKAKNQGITGKEVMPGSHTKLHWITPRGRLRYCSVKDMVKNYRYDEH